MNTRALEGALLGTAVGDAWGLPCEGMTPRMAQWWLAGAPRFSLLGRTGRVSDDTEQSALVVQSVLRGGADDAAIERAFRRSLLGWVLRLPFGVGLATLRAGLRLLFGFRVTGVRSAGNGAAMRSPVLGVLFATDEARRRALVQRLAQVTHLEARAVAGAQFVAEVAALLTQGGRSRHEVVLQAAAGCGDAQIREAVERAVALGPAEFEVVARTLGNTGYVVHSVAVCSWALVHAGPAAMSVLRSVISVGGDTDTHAAIVGAWLGAEGGAEVFDPRLVSALQGGPFGRAHLQALARAATGQGPVPKFSSVFALLRNLALYPVVLAHGFARPVIRLLSARA